MTLPIRTNLLASEAAIYVAIVSFTHAPTIAACAHLQRTLATIDIALDLQGLSDDLVHTRSAQLALVSVINRRDRIGVLAVSALDALTLRAAAPHIAEAIGRIRLNTFFIAHAVAERAQNHGRGALLFL